MRICPLYLSLQGEPSPTRKVSQEYHCKKRRDEVPANGGTTPPTVARNDKAGVLRQTPRRGKNKPLPLSPLQGEPFPSTLSLRTKCRVNPSPFHVENPATGGGDGDIGGEVKKISRKEYFSAFA